MGSGNASGKPGRKGTRSWLAILLGFAEQCKGRLFASLMLSLASVGAGFVPFYAVYRVMGIVMDGAGGGAAAVPGPTAGAAVPTAILPWLALAAAGYVASKLLFGCSTILSHISAYTILGNLRRAFINRLLKASLGTVRARPIGHIKNVFLDRIEAVEIPLAHMIPELTGSLVLAVGVVAWIVAIDWRLALAVLVSVALGLVAFAGGLASYSKTYEGYMAASNRVNSVMVEYIEGIRVVKAFNQATGSYQRYADAVTSFRDFTLAWFRSTWVSMNLALSIMPTTLLGVLPAALALYLAGVLDPASIGLALVLSLAVVDQVMRFTTFMNELKAVEFAVRDVADFLDLPELAEP